MDKVQLSTHPVGRAIAANVLAENSKPEDVKPKAIAIAMKMMTQKKYHNHFRRGYVSNISDLHLRVCQRYTGV
jgi:hypothetical protein